MRILGINKGKTSFGKPLRDGAVALVEDGKLIFAIAEERLTRKLRDGGFSHCIDVIASELRIDPFAVDKVAVSTCCENSDSAAFGHQFEGHPKLVCIPHHESHAWGAYLSSGFDTALVIVMDGGGNVLVNNANNNWWEEKREQHSYFVANAKGLEKIDEDFVQPWEVGFGELYRAATYFLGWNSSRFAGNVMALSTYGNPTAISNKRIFNFETNGKLSLPIRYDNVNPAKMISSIFDIIGISPLEPISSDTMADELSPDHWNFAAYLQWNIEEALIWKLKQLQKATNIDNVCLTGGTALNCVLNGKIAGSNIFKRVFVPIAPGDHGQCIGNAFYTWYKEKASKPKPLNTTVDGYTGLPSSSSINSASIAIALKQHNLQNCFVLEFKDLELAVANILNDENAICILTGRSEFGLRALGNRSILMRADSKISQFAAGYIKKREWFRPFAPAVLEEIYQNDFEIKFPSPFMSFALPIKNSKRSKYVSAISKANTARLQTVNEDSFIGRVLVALKKIGAYPICLNTSFNLSGEPIVESIHDALHTFKRMPINSLVAGRFLIVKKLLPSYNRLGLIDYKTLPEAIIRSNNSESALSTKQGLLPLLRNLQNRTRRVVFFRSGFSLFGDYLVWLRKGTKKTTIRWRREGIEWPMFQKMPLWETSDKQRKPLDRDSIDETVDVIKIVYVKFGELTESDARNDGFESHNQMRMQFRERIYPEILDDDWVSIYHLTLGRK